MKQRQGDPMVLLSALAARPGKLVIATLGIGPPPGHGLVIPLLTAGVNKKGRKSQDATVRHFNSLRARHFSGPPKGSRNRDCDVGKEKVGRPPLPTVN